MSRDQLVGYRCQGSAPTIVVDAGTPRERRYLGGPFATPVPDLPVNAEVLGVGGGIQAVSVPSLGAMYTVQGTSASRWLALPPADEIRPGGPTAFMIGDSILDGGQFDITASLPEWTIGFDALNGRGSVSGIPIAETQADAGDDVVVVELGTNDQSVDAFRDHARQIMDSLKDVPLVLWQTIKGPEDVVSQTEINTAIGQMVSARPNAAIADWATAVGDEELTLDGIHPTSDHEDAMARILTPLLRQWWGAVTDDDPRCG
jgi:hypothetical protein